MKRLAVLIALVSLLMPSQIATAAGTDAYDPNRVPIASDQIMMTLEELGRAVPHSSIAAEQEVGAGGFQARVATCKSLTDERCDPTKVKGFLMADVILPHCSKSLSEFCVESLELAPAGGVLKPATFLRNAQSDWSWAPDTSTMFAARERSSTLLGVEYARHGNVLVCSDCCHQAELQSGSEAVWNR